MDRFVQQMPDITLKYTREIWLTNLAMNFLCCLGIWALLTRLGRKNDHKFRKNEEPDMGASGTFVTWLYTDLARPEN